MLSTLLGMMTEVRLEQLKNASSPMLVTLPGMVTEVSGDILLTAGSRSSNDRFSFFKREVRVLQVDAKPLCFKKLVILRLIFMIVRKRASKTVKPSPLNSRSVRRTCG